MALDEGSQSAVDGLKQLVSEAHAGNIKIEMTADGFAQIDKDMQTFKDGVDGLLQIVYQIAQQDHYGLGEDHPDLTSAHALVAKLKAKARGGPNSAYDVLKAYSDGADQIQQMFKASRDHYVAADRRISNSVSTEAAQDGRA